MARPAATHLHISRRALAASLAVLFFSGFGFARLYPFESQPTLADLASELERTALSDGEIAFDDATSPEEANAPQDLKSQLKIFSDEHNRLKAYEAQIRRRVDSIDTLLSEIDRLEHGSAEGWSESPSRSLSRRGRARLGVGGGDGPRSPVIHFEGKSEKNALPPNPSAAKTGSGERVSLLLNELDKQITRLASVPVGAPVTGNISSGFGWRQSPFSSEGSGHTHQGVDFSIDRLSSVSATAEGLVVNAGPKGAYGIAVIIKHKNGFETLYGHLAKVSVKPGEKVCRGQQIGYVGSSGRSTAPHLHYEVRVDGNPRDPLPYIEMASFVRLLRTSDSV